MSEPECDTVLDCQLGDVLAWTDTEPRAAEVVAMRVTGDRTPGRPIRWFLTVELEERGKMTPGESSASEEVADRG